LNRYQRAAQLWPLLAWAAINRQTLTYQIVGQLTGLPHYSLGDFLEPIQSYCILNELPPLTAIVVSSVNGHPGNGNIEAANALVALVKIYSHDWTSTRAPTPEIFESAIQQHPSNAAQGVR
jgi:hypothetical protein